MDHQLEVETFECLGAHREATLHYSAGSRLLLLGEDNPQSSDPAFALWDDPPACAGNRLRDILGLSSAAYRAIWRTNLCCPSWSAKKADARARELCVVDDPEDSQPWLTVVMLGRKVSDAVGKLHGVRFDAFQVRKLGPVRAAMTYVCLPHPSGRCRAWNDPDAAVQARFLVRHQAPELFT